MTMMMAIVIIMWINTTPVSIIKIIAFKNNNYHNNINNNYDNKSHKNINMVIQIIGWAILIIITKKS